MTNTGQSLQTFGSASLNILWPYELINKKWLLYPSALQIDGHPHTRCEPQSALDPLRLAQTEHLKVLANTHQMKLLLINKRKRRLYGSSVNRAAERCARIRRPKQTWFPKTLRAKSLQLCLRLRGGSLSHWSVSTRE